MCLEVFKWITLATYCNVVRFLSSLSVRAEFMRCVLSIVAEPAQPFSQSVSLSNSTPPVVFGVFFRMCVSVVLVYGLVNWSLFLFSPLLLGSGVIEKSNTRD